MKPHRDKTKSSKTKYIDLIGKTENTTYQKLSFLLFFHYKTELWRKNQFIFGKKGIFVSV